ncbi:hypothetical protein ACQW02_22815 [Humitalea sp. 24SJ18S-53]|uniref:hypothetical protein n=1 Tax=Humitalea sp. 24SJ18S-53 TaxID=3422307 RepID=UPI003D66A872
MPGPDLRLLSAAVLGLWLAAGPALADRSIADRCAAALPAAGKTLYDRALPTVTSGTAIPDALRSAARSLVMAGFMTRDVARPAAEAAGGCLSHLNSVS